MQVEELQIPDEKIEQELTGFKRLVKSHRNQVIEQAHKDLQSVYGHMQHGGKVIEISSSFKKAGLDEIKNPRLAICRADAEMCHLAKHNDGSVVYSSDRFKPNAKQSSFTGRQKSLSDVYLPPETFIGFPHFDWDTPQSQFMVTSVPIIPTSVLAPLEEELSNYHIIWEVEEWDEDEVSVPPPRDPILVKLVNNNIALVLATWDLTPLERAVIKGRL